MPATSFHFVKGVDAFTIRLNWESIHVEVSTFVESIREPEPFFNFSHPAKEREIVLTPAGEQALRDLFERPPPVHVDVDVTPSSTTPRLGLAPKKKRPKT
jgi:hypothetical protein